FLLSPQRLRGRVCTRFCTPWGAKTRSGETRGWWLRRVGSVGRPRLLEVTFACVSLVHRRVSSAGVDRAGRTWRSSEGAGDSRAPPRAVDPSPPGRAAAVRGARPSAAGGVQPDAAAPLVERVLGAAGDAPCLASSAGGPALDISAPTSWPAADPLRASRAGRASRAREPELG